MSEDRSDKEDNNDLFANNRGVIKSWKGLVLAIVAVGGFIGYLALLVVLSLIPSLQWLTPALTGLLFFVVGIIFLKLSKTSYILPLFAMLIGTLLMYIATFDKYFPIIRDTMGDKISGTVMIVYGIIMLIYPFAVNSYYKRRYKVTVEATVIYVDYHISRTRKVHVRTYRPVYEFTYSGKVYQVADKVFSSGSHPVKGEERDLLIDENKPEHFFDPERMRDHRSLSSYVYPIILLVLGLYLIVA